MYYFLKLFSKLPLIFIQSSAKAVGRFLYTSNSSAKKTTSENLKIAYPILSNEEHEHLLKLNLQHQCMTYAESIKVWGSSIDFSLQQIKHVHQSKLFFNALKNPNGTLAIVPHFGNWEIMNAWVNQYTNPVIMYKPSKNKGLDKFMLESRNRLNATLVPTDDTGVRALFRHLKSGGFSAILPDHVPKESGGIYAPFYGKNVLSPTLLSKLAAKTQCSVIGMYCLRNQDLDGFDLHFYQVSNEILSKDLITSVTALNHDLEIMINFSPEQYLWGYKRFRKMKA
ncbi:lipid A biosynthesis acyltransferase [Acinetobacter sp. ANC 4558]|uniref:lysophospholipid acyltransferase family protein n=1 Tax=Acinetobacter sp. ANC 4558 TaxID=1977876 RepID=UPI000A33CC3F|nr:lysophospholipid acyltransferase family protein [Acinetobacter sp. ANC 4558]OTG83215.1 lipid A biosynthesis acyltransferase [Acinetobacter sp. ANC 4558]